MNAERRGGTSPLLTRHNGERERGAAGSVRPRGQQAASTWTLVTVEVGKDGEVIWGPGQQAEAGGHGTVGGGEGRGGSHPCGTQVDIARVGDSVRREGASRGIAATMGTNGSRAGDRRQFLDQLELRRYPPSVCHCRRDWISRYVE